jgi:RHS repeat-associated protein
MAVSENGNAPQLFYTYTDHLGSITAVTNAQGNVIARQNFDAWGRRRNALDYSYLPQHTTTTDNGISTSGNLPAWLYRGYTGHEHLDEIALINMNARLYDPVLGMMLSPDNYIQDPSLTQNYNRYGYCFNNPLKYTDPSGNISEETWRNLRYMALGSILGMASWQPLIKHYKGEINTEQAIGLYLINAGAFVASAGVGSAVSGALSFSGAAAGAITGAASGFTSGFIVGAGSSFVYGQSGHDILINGLKGGGIGAGAGGLLGGITGGYKSYKQGKDFWHGGEKAKVYRSPVKDNFGKERGECVYKCLEEFSNSYGVSETDASYWMGQNDGKLFVSPNKVENLIDGSGVFSSDQISPDINSITEAISKDQRVLMGFEVNNEGHAVMVSKVKVWPSGRYRVWFAETSPVRLAPYSTDNVLDGSRFYTFYMTP